MLVCIASAYHDQSRCPRGVPSSSVDRIAFDIVAALLYHCSMRAINFRPSVEYSRRQHASCTRCKTCHSFPSGKCASVAALYCHTSPWQQSQGISSSSSYCTSLVSRRQAMLACTAVGMGEVLLSAMLHVQVLYQAHLELCSTMETNREIHFAACGSHTQHHPHTWHKGRSHC